MKRRRPPEVCPVCDADVPPNSKACPNCGACYESGWKDDDDDESREEIDYDVLDLPDEVLDEEELRAKRKREINRIIPIRWRWIALILVAIWLLYFFLSRGAFQIW